MCAFWSVCSFLSPGLPDRETSLKTADVSGPGSHMNVVMLPGSVYM